MEYGENNNMIKVNLEDIFKKRAFIYEIDDDYYILGQNIMKKISVKCTDAKIYRTYKNMLEQYKPLADSTYDEIVKDETAVKRFKHVLNHADIADNCKREELLEFIDGLSENEKDSLHNKLNIFVRLFNKWYKHNR